MDEDLPAAIDVTVEDAITQPNIKVIVADWVALGEKVMMDQLVHVSSFGHLLQPDDPVIQREGGVIDQWLAFAAAHRAALDFAEQHGGLHQSLMPWAYPQFDRFVLHFMNAAIKARHKATG